MSKPTIPQFIEQRGITMDTKPTDHNPHMEGGETMDHWRCTLRRSHGDARRTLTITFSMGSGHNGRAPEPAEVLSSLALDAGGCDQDFHTWCSDYGYSDDSIKAERTYRQCCAISKRLRRFLGPEDFEALLYDTESY